ncbi:MAG: hypothetical protein AAF547_10605 [Actinomycetota bacterium]
MAQLSMTTESAQELSARYVDQEGAIGTARAEVKAIIDQVEALLNEAQATEARMNAALDTLNQSTTTTLTSAQGVEWTGASRERFTAATSDLVATIDRTRANMTDAYGEFRASAQNLNVALRDVGNQFDTASAEAEAATQEYRGTLDAHIQDVDELFARGIS